jgi:hypothetical protein
VEIWSTLIQFTNADVSDYSPRTHDRILRPFSIKNEKSYAGKSIEFGELSQKKQKCLYKNHAVNDSLENASSKVSFDKAHVYKSKDNVTYACNLFKVEHQLDYNNFYCLKILAADCGEKFWFLQEFGRIDTDALKFILKLRILIKQLKSLRKCTRNKLEMILNQLIVKRNVESMFI